MAKEDVGCAKPTGSVVGGKERGKKPVEPAAPERGTSVSQVFVGKKAPGFEAPAYVKGKFINVKLSDYFGKWILLCFYPGDFTFV